MKRLLLVLSFLFFISACSSNSSVTFTGVIETIHESSLLVTTSDDIGFDRAYVGYDKNMKIDFEPFIGQTVEISIKPEVRESYPVQVTAVMIKPISSEITEKEEPVYMKITAQKAKEMMDNEHVLIVDVRTKAEFDEGYIPNAILLPDHTIRESAEEVLPDKDEVILLYCRTGRRSEWAAKELIDMGYRNVYDFGGIFDWPFEIVKP